MKQADSRTWRAVVWCILDYIRATIWIYSQIYVVKYARPPSKRLLYKLPFKSWLRLMRVMVERERDGWGAAVLLYLQ